MRVLTKWLPWQHDPRYFETFTPEVPQKNIVQSRKKPSNQHEKSYN